ncbi:cohesin domain-containing protein [Clostridium intestinale]|uniref:Cohesin domain-containing protein n=1 Tax=Clostridium intestinale DSM 6191 TaxID=1121320 RepID=A0A1M6FH39_9CLOT|nr:cohesin domain-containing protein [Clostridium intestinale]SHI96912.1 hypothetical protein SAMN02745941_04634 [Clostridium intestinale DSM 6191]
MKKKVVLIYMFFMFTFSFSAFGATNTNVDLGGEISLNSGEDFEITVKINNVERLYAGSISIDYDNYDISFNEIVAGGMVLDSGFQKFEAGGAPNNEKNRISYQFTFMGEVVGVNGSGDFVKIKGKANRDIKFNLNNISMVKLVERTDKNAIQSIPFTYIGKEVNENNSTIIENTNNNTSNENKDNVEVNSQTNVDENKVNSSSSTVKEGDSTNKESSEENKDKSLMENDNETESESGDVLNKNNNYILVVIGALIIIFVGSGVYIKKFRK